MSDRFASLSELSGKRVLVTGHTGFKGSWLCLALAELGAKTHGFALAPPTTPSHFVLSDIQATLARHDLGDIRDIDAFAASVDATDPEVIFHLAAQPIVRTSYQAPLDTFAINVMGTANLLEIVRRRGRPCVVVVATSDKVYENVGQVFGYREIDVLGGHDPYSASKGAAEIVAASYRKSFFAPERVGTHGVKLATARAGNVIGGGDFARDRLVVDAVRALAEGRPVPIRNPRSIRPWQHVLEPLFGYMSLAARLISSNDSRFADAWNFGPRAGDELSVSALVERLCAAWGGGAAVDASEPGAPHEAGVLRLSIDKALVELGVGPRLTVDDAVAWTARWYRKWAALGEMRASDAAVGRMREASLADLRAYRALGA